MKATSKKNLKQATADYSWLYLLILPVLALLVFSPCMSFGVTNWDDNHYIRELLLIRSLSWENIVTIFKTKVLLSYNPLVILSFAVDYKLGGNSESWYHVTNIILHAINGVLVFVVMRHLLKKSIHAFLVAVFFCIHPMHVESVAWIACRKDVLYTMFFLLSWLSYLLYFKKESPSNSKYLFYAISLLCFLCSGFSKIQAVVLPPVLLLSDYLLTGRLNTKQLKDKIPFFTGAIAFGYYAISSSSLVADQFSVPVSLSEKIVYSFQAFSYYIIKFIFPLNQSAIYAFPLQGSAEYYSTLISGVVFFLIIIFICIRYYQRSPLLVAGLLIFLINILPTLHIVALNSSLIYERFTYVSYLGLLMIIVSVSDWIPAIKKSLSLILILLALPVAVMAYQRCGIWKSSFTLWSDVIKKNPRSHEAFNNRGAHYNEQGDLDKALNDFNTSLSINARQPRTLNNRSMIWFQKKEYQQALNDADAALSFDPRLAEAWCNKANVYYNLAQYDTALFYYSKAISILPYFPSVYTNRGSAFLKKGDYQNALNDYLKAIEQMPNYAEAWRLAALAYAELDRDQEALNAMNRALTINPSSNVAVVLSEEYNFMGQRAFNQHPDSPDKPMDYYLKALQINGSNASAYLNLGGMWFVKHDVAKARDNWKKALANKPGYEEAILWLNRTGGLN